MPYSIQIIGFGNKKEMVTQEAQRYRQLLAPYASLSLTYLKSMKGSKIDSKEICHQEGKLFFSKWPKNSYPVALSEEGKMVDSLSFSKWLSQRTISSIPLTFIIGGAYGLSASVKNKCKEVISLSRLTLPYRLCYLILIEQLYRAFTILKGHPYHKQ